MKKEEGLPPRKGHDKQTKTPWAAAHRAKIKSPAKSVKVKEINKD